MIIDHLVFIGLSILLTVSSPHTANLLSGNSQTQQDKLRLQYLNETKRFLQSKEKNPGIYWGEGIASIVNNDLGEAKIKAKKRALSDLSGKISIRVESDVKRTVTGSTTTSGKIYTETIIDQIEEKIHTYTNQVLTDVSEQGFAYYPGKGYYTYFVYIFKEAYQQKVKKDLDAKKAMIKTAFNGSESDFGSDNFLVALNKWIVARSYLKNFFGLLPVQADLNDDGRSEEISSYLEGKVNSFFGNIQLEFLQSKINYDAQGKPTQKPRIYARFKDELGNLKPVANLPLKIDFISGAGKLQGNTITTNYGQAEIPLTYVDPANTSTPIMVTIDKSKIPGLEDFSPAVFPRARLNLSKIKTVALAVSFNNNNQYLVLEDLIQEIKSVLLGKGFSTIVVRLNGNNVESSDISRAGSTNADYFLAIMIHAQNATTVGGFKNMYISDFSGRLSLYKLPQGTEIQSETVPSVRGYGVSGKSAGWDAYARRKKTIINKVSTLADRLP